MPGSKTSRSSSTVSQDNEFRNRAHALLGATRAFEARPSPAPRVATINTTHATMSTRHPGSASDGWSNAVKPNNFGKTLGQGPGTPMRTPMETKSPPIAKARSIQSLLTITNSPTFSEPGNQQTSEFPSHSHHAALLASARLPPTETVTPRAARARANTSSQRPPIAPKPRRLSEQRADSEHKPDTSMTTTDNTPIPPTTSLVDLFERKSSNAKRPEPIVVRPSQEMTIQSPKPIRSSEVSGAVSSVFNMEMEEHIQTVESSIETINARDHIPTPDHNLDSPSPEEYASASEDHAPSSPIAVARRRSRGANASPKRSPQKDSLMQPLLEPTRPLSTQPIRIQPPPRNITSQPTAFSASSHTSTKSLQAQFHQLYPRRMTPLNTGDQLANAIVASSLASSRAPSPRKPDPPPVPAHKRQKHHKLGFSRTPSPTKHGMLHTLRKPESDTESSGDERHPYGKHRKKRLVRKHPNKHHEGDRKRWRDAVTERERKRYDGVWAANKGLHCELTQVEANRLARSPHWNDVKDSFNDRVFNLVVREIWNRSRLPEDVLETVWDLVDNDGIGRLSKDEFVIGMWLIDQCLKGRKLPIKVSETVWASVRTLHGIKIKK